MRHSIIGPALFMAIAALAVGTMIAFHPAIDAVFLDDFASVFVVGVQFGAVSALLVGVARIVSILDGIRTMMLAIPDMRI